MIIHRMTEPHNKGYTKIDNRLLERPIGGDLNATTMLIHLYLLSRIDGWETSRQAICDKLRIVPTTLNNALRELRTYGLLEVSQRPGKKDYIYTVYEIPVLSDKESINKKENEVRELLEELRTQWEINCYSCLKVNKLTRTDEINLATILNDPDFPVDKDYIIEQMKRIQQSDFATGNNKTGWKMTFSKFLADFTDIINGKYDGKRMDDKRNQFTNLREKLESQRNEQGGFDL